MLEQITLTDDLTIPFADKEAKPAVACLAGSLGSLKDKV